jgi:hypothetical protein
MEDHKKHTITKKQIILIVAIVILFLIALIDWSLWTWFGLAGIILVILGWSIKK